MLWLLLLVLLHGGSLFTEFRLGRRSSLLGGFVGGGVALLTTGVVFVIVPDGWLFLVCGAASWLLHAGAYLLGGVVKK